MTIDGRSGSVLRLHAVPVSGPAFLPSAQVPGTAAFLAALGLSVELLPLRSVTGCACRCSRRGVSAVRLLSAAAAR